MKLACHPSTAVHPETTTDPATLRWVVSGITLPFAAVSYTHLTLPTIYSV